MTSDCCSRSEAQQACVEWYFSLVAASHALTCLHVMLKQACSQTEYFVSALPVSICRYDALIPFYQCLPSKCLRLVTWLHMNCKMCSGC